MFLAITKCRARRGQAVGGVSHTAISIFGIVVGVALLLTGVGFIVLSLAALPTRTSDGAAAQTASVPT